MEDKITVIFTKRNWNPVSWLIRWCIPRSRFHLSQSSHCLIVDGDYLIEATMMHGVRRVLIADAMKGQTEITRVVYNVADAEAGIRWLRNQVGSKYDFKGALGLALSPYRDWKEDDCWFCYELAAAALAKAGKDIFKSYGHITETNLMAIKP